MSMNSGTYTKQHYNLMAHGFLLFLLFSYIISTNIHACKQAERSSLLSFASTLSSPPLNWTSIDCCRWKGITCNKDGWVTHLLLPSKGLKGGLLPSSLANLTHITHLNLSHNSLYGSLETQFFLSLNRLQILDLSYNLLSGELPLSLPSSNIQTLDLSSNHFHGAIPSSFFQQASNLTSFNVSNNIFEGFFEPVTITSQDYFQKISIMLPNLKKLHYLSIHYVEPLVIKLSTSPTLQSLTSTLINSAAGFLLIWGNSPS
ncbi:hypothetical protein ACE6H2_014359 [Prunus campanulata]